MAATAPSEDVLEKYLNIKSTIAGIADATGLATAITIYVQAVDNSALRHQGVIKSIAFANIILLGTVFVMISVVSVFLTKRTGGAWMNRTCSINSQVLWHYFIGLITIVTTILALTLAALSGTKPESFNATTTMTTTT